MKVFRTVAAVGISCALLLAAAQSADARVRHEGTWPDGEKNVTIDLDGVKRAEAVRKLAEAAGWSVVVHAPPGDPVDVHVTDQPPAKVLDLVLADADYVATRDGTLVSIDRDVAAPSTAPSTATARGEDRNVMGGNLVIAKGETAHDVTVMGGNLEVYGSVTGDVTVFGGNVRVHEGARIAKDCTMFGGNVSLDDGASVDGHVVLVGGRLHRAKGAHVGEVSRADDNGDDDEGVHARGSAGPGQAEVKLPLHVRLVSSVSHGLRLAAVLFVIGTMLIALAGRRMDTLRAEIAARPMRTLALGFVGVFASIVVLIALCVTIIGIPIALVAALVGAFAALTAMSAAMSVAGEALLRHKTQNPYVHLAFGCGIFVMLAWIPWVGAIVVWATVLIGIGSLVATRAAGLVARKNGKTATSV